MKRMFSISQVIICILFGFLPISKIIGVIFRYDIVLSSYPIFSVALAIISLITVVLLFALKPSISKVQSVFSVLALPLSAINGLSYIFESSWRPTIIFVLICCVCAVVMFIRFAKPLVLKIVFAVLSALLILGLLFFGYWDIVFQDFGKDTVVKSITSPSNTYIAEVIASDQGALGGDTIVTVRLNRNPIDLFFFELSSLPKRLYLGEWGQFENMQISWEDENTHYKRQGI